MNNDVLAEERAPADPAGTPEGGRYAMAARALKLAAPTIFESSLQSVVYLVDALILARVGREELAAVSLSGILLWRTSMLAGFLQIGTAALVSRRWGARAFVEGRKVATHGMILNGAIGLGVAALLAPFIPATLRMLGGGQDSHVDLVAAQYCWAILAAFPFMLMRMALVSALRAAGDTRTPMYSTVLVNVVNIALNYPLVFGKFGFHPMGMLGSGIATAIALTCGFIWLAWRCRRGIDTPALWNPVEQEGGAEPLDSGEAEGGVFRLARSGVTLRLGDTTRSMFSVAMPSFFEELILTVAFFSFYHMIASFGTIAQAAHTASGRLEALSFMAGFGVAVASSTLVGQALGRGDPRQARLAIEQCTILSALIMGAIGALLAIFCTPLLSFFTKDNNPEFMAIATRLLLIVAISQPLIATGMALGGGLRGAGDTLSPTISQLIGAILVRVGGGWLFAYKLGLGVDGVYWAMLLDWLTRTVILGYLVARGRWSRIKL